MPLVGIPEQREKRLARLKITGKAWRERNPDYFKNYSKRVIADPVAHAALLVKQQQWRDEHKESERQRSQRRREADPETNRAYRLAWYHAHKEQARAAYQRDRPRRLENATRWANDHREHRRKYLAQYQQENPVKMAELSARRRARKRNCEVNPEQIEAWMLRVRAVGAPCYYCGVKVKGSNIDFDHIVPLARGGPHEISNLCASCGPCNRRKHTKLISEWQRQPQQILSL